MRAAERQDLVLVVEDEEPIRRATSRQLERSGYVVRSAGDAHEALAVLAQEDVALVLCDIDLPGRSGLSLLDDIRADHPTTAVVMVTGVDDADTALRALEDGAFGYVIKPFGNHELQINVANALRRRRLEQENLTYRTMLEHLVDERTAELRASREELIRRLSFAADYKDEETASHIERMSRFAEVLAHRAGLPDDQCELVRLAAPMHDIGKIGIPDAVLCKTGRYDEDDRAIMRSHPEIGYGILEGSSSELVQLAAVMALGHHEWFDGSGYPGGLAGSAIPIAARIVAIADVFDALTTARRYKDAMTLAEARRVMEVEEPGHFDPELLALFFADVEVLEEIMGLEVDAAHHLVGTAPSI